jgi:hypothetical protein
LLKRHPDCKGCEQDADGLFHDETCKVAGQGGHPGSEFFAVESRCS